MAENETPVKPETRLPYSLADDTDAPSIYVDGVAGAIQSNGVVKIRCFELVLSGANEVNSKPTSRVNLHLAMAVPTLLAFLNALSGLKTGLEADGIIKKAVQDSAEKTP